MPGPHLHLSLRTKLALALAAAALLPLLVVSAVGIRVSLGRIERGLRVQARQTAQIALNLLLRQVQRIAALTSHLAEDPELHELLALDPTLVGRFLELQRGVMDAESVEVVLPDRRVVAEIAPRTPGRQLHAYVRPDSPVLPVPWTTSGG
jgi:C4-dicarboxylate-specific signal transduction histidine kinase